MDVFIANEQSDVECDEQRFIRLAKVAAGSEPVPPGSELSVLLVDRTTMAGLKAKWLGEDGPTDVLAFPMDEQPLTDDDLVLLGDIVICPDVAREQAAQHNSETVKELDLLFVHGFLHLLGYDHVKPADARTMRHRERKILAEFYGS